MLQEDLEIIFEDDSLLVVNKPANLVIEPTSTSQNQTLVDQLKVFNISLDRSGIVHRLDKDTSGLLLVAKTQSSLTNLQQQFKDRLVKKEYTALAHGHLTEEVTVEQPIIRSPFDREKFTTDQDGKYALTRFIPLKQLNLEDHQIAALFPDFNKIQLRKLHQLSYPDFTLIRALPLTGRTHQIRVHLKYLSSPIVADEKYVGRKMYRLDHRWCPRQFLHATRITFFHPINHETMTFDCPLPSDLQTALNYLKEK